MKPRSTLQCAPALHHSIKLLIETYTEPVPLNMENLPHNFRVYNDIFYSEQLGECAGKL